MLILWLGCDTVEPWRWIPAFSGTAASFLRIENSVFPKIFISAYKTIRCHNPDIHNMNTYRHEYLKVRNQVNLLFQMLLSGTVTDLRCCTDLLYIKWGYENKHVGNVTLSSVPSICARTTETEDSLLIIDMAVPFSMWFKQSPHRPIKHVLLFCINRLSRSSRSG